MKAIRVRIEFFGPAKELAGKEVVETCFARVDDGVTTVARLRKHVFKVYPRLAPFGNLLRFAIKDEFVSDDRIVTEGDVVSVIPPVSGG